LSAFNINVEHYLHTWFLPDIKNPGQHAQALTTTGWRKKGLHHIKWVKFKWLPQSHREHRGFSRLPLHGRTQIQVNKSLNPQMNADKHR